MRFTIAQRLTIAAAVAVAPASAAHAWNESGHRIVARIAWDELTRPQQVFASELLVRHPRFAEDFAAHMPPDIAARAADDPERQRWVFMHAAIWPDLLKGEGRRLSERIAALPAGAEKTELERRLADVKRYDNPTWHYDNKPIHIDPYALPPAPAPGAKPVGVQQALPNALRELDDRNLPAERRAVALAWVLHLLGDSHQPLHSVSLFSARHLPQGDLGGNVFFVVKPRPADPTPVRLHAVWDDMLGTDPKLEAATKRQIVAAFPRSRLKPELAEPADPLAVEAMVNLWLDESFRAADTSVYDANLRAALLAPLPTGATSALPVALDRRYLPAALPVARRRAALAGYRLADCIRRAESRSRP
ncbi:S1/P1 nuclease [Nannocystis sp. SCPEA4]|uniref:S1/P1 nuclease n=1 Tax=Nannocystis sp. SCPEA4 TaxID=2996787 RepID=UPI002270DD72|nr:S1/P1 nuclease [Nannocystis sp. SCPEA4]MCY1061466.1 S1/P1 nuclease [Nannocystis sp. SCPEA4]